jgi:hypothetical protein
LLPLKACDDSEVALEQGIDLLAATSVHLRGHLEDAITTAVERTQISGFIELCIGAYASESSLLYKERDFERSVVTPEAHAAAALIVASASIWET